ncbi:hypothetical protein [Kribbella ginsengisoli]|uniref:Uncharacterized protein n=1 Tax=Kribbella ginsengisoli TaxID=363865 RepID=A0ABP6YTW7_9ACTN
MTITTTTTATPLPTIGGWSAAIGGLAITVLGVIAAVQPDTAGPAWFAVAGAAAVLFAGGLSGLRIAVRDVRTAYRALTVSIFMVLTAVALIVAGVAVLRTRIWPDGRRFALLAAGVWPLATIPAGAALGDVPHFTAIAVWGLLWTTLGAILLNTGVRHP